MSLVNAPRVLSIAGTDPSGGAGLHADLKSIAAAGGYGMAVVTALVAQNTRGVRAVHTPPVEFLRQQLDAVCDDVEIDAVKIGMLGSAEVIVVIDAWLAEHAPSIVVLDPVMVATSGDRLLDADAETALRELVSRASVVTPNVPELAILADGPEAVSWEQVLVQARQVAEHHEVIVLAKGGHLEGDQVFDALVGADGVIAEFVAPRVHSTNTHGTGCSLSSGLATRYAAMSSLPEAVAETKRWLTESISHGAELEVGGGHGPVSHFAGMWQRGGLLTRPPAEAVTTSWWERTAVIRKAIENCDFVTSLGGGILDPLSFARYLAQDAIYLRDYSRALARASALAPTAKEQSFWADGARSAVATELGLHESWLPSGDSTVASAVTRTYVDHLLAASSRSYEELAAALLPCYWLYWHVATRLSEISSADHPYRAWLDTYADEGFAEATRTAIETVGAIAARSDDDTREKMFVAFERSVELELAFFEVPPAR